MSPWRMISLRNFSLDLETLATEWRAAALIEMPWTFDESMSSLPGEAQGFHVVSSNVFGYAKASAPAKKLQIVEGLLLRRVNLRFVMQQIYGDQ